MLKIVNVLDFFLTAQPAMFRNIPGLGVVLKARGLINILRVWIVEDQKVLAKRSIAGNCTAV